MLVQMGISLVSAGTERMIIDLAKKSLIGKAKARPDLVRKVIEDQLKEVPQRSSVIGIGIS